MLLIPRILRRLRRIPEPVVSRDQALQIAESVARAEGLSWTMPLVIEELRTWVVRTAAHTIPSPWIVIDN
jgi:hypothetical protein